MSNTPGQFVWYDLMSPDVDAATRFYTEAIGWGTQQWDGSAPYTMWTANGVPIGGIVPLTDDHAAAGVVPHWMTYVTVSDVDATIEKARAHSAEIIAEPRDVEDIGRLAVIRDPQGALIALYKPRADFPSGAPSIGQFSWHELTTSDSEAAFDFYTDLFGWEKVSEMDMGEDMGVYQMFGQNGSPFGGMMNGPANTPISPSWVCYVRVADVDAAAERVKRLGGKVTNGPMEVPGGDRIANCLDPHGAAFSIHQMKG